MKKFLFNAVVTAIGLPFSVYAQNTLPKVADVFHIASPGNWDFIAVGPDNNRLYVSHATQVNILDLKTGDSAGVISNTTGVHGIAFAKTLQKGYVSNGKLNNVTVFDLKTNEVLTQIATGEKPDVILYEAFSKKILTCNGVGKNISVIDPQTDKVVATIALGGEPEAAVSDDKGKIYVNIADKSEIEVISMSENKVLNHWSLAPGEEPTGLAFDKNTNRLFSGCENKQLIVMNALNGKVIANLPIGGDCDGVVFDNRSKIVYAANGAEGTVTAIKEQSPSSFKVIANIVTKKGARTICIDESTHKLYLPTADLGKNIATGAKRPSMIPGTFQVLVLY